MGKGVGAILVLIGLLLVYAALSGRVANSLGAFAVPSKMKVGS